MATIRAVTFTVRFSLTHKGLDMREIEVKTMQTWLRTGAITETERGSENAYFVDQFDNEYFCKVHHTHHVDGSPVDLMTL